MTILKHAIAPIIKAPKNKLGAPALTDFANIFICTEATERDNTVLLKHEQLHIWLKHNKRSYPEIKDMTPNPAKWREALELEIAINFYTEEDERIIASPFSCCHGGLTRKTHPNLPKDIILAEDIYKWLMFNKEDGGEGQGPCLSMKMLSDEDIQNNSGGSKDDDNDDTSSKSVTLTKEELEEIKKAIKEKSIDLEARVYTKTKLKMPKASLASYIDFILREAYTKETTFFKPSRREVTPYILKGRKKVKKSPLVEIFIDRSGSFSGERTKLSELKIGSILQKYRAKIQSDVFYFSNDKLYNHDVQACGGNPYPLVMEHLEKSRPKIAIILTDDDLEGDLKPLSHNDTKIICVPIGVDKTTIAPLIGAVDLI